MDKLTEYPKLIKRILTEYIELSNRRPNRDIETFLIVDEPKNQYIWMNLGWQNGERVTGMTVYVRIRDRKFWIEEDWTEDGIATDLVRAGVCQGRYIVGIP
ncbi:element excision factor XisI family protein [Nostoc sp.]|uniref:element excision factor XisI family protein n=1 Tax=Nostoc sp. TaxID=1180 RepID=UPI003FA58C55